VPQRLSLDNALADENPQVRQRAIRLHAKSLSPEQLAALTLDLDLQVRLALLCHCGEDLTDSQIDGLLADAEIAAVLQGYDERVCERVVWFYNYRLSPAQIANVLEDECADVRIAAFPCDRQSTHEARGEYVYPLATLLQDESPAVVSVTFFL
jgi:hypothetical protein